MIASLHERARYRPRARPPVRSRPMRVDGRSSTRLAGRGRTRRLLPSLGRGADRTGRRDARRDRTRPTACAPRATPSTAATASLRAAATARSPRSRRSPPTRGRRARRRAHRVGQRLRPPLGIDAQATARRPRALLEHGHDRVVDLGRAQTADWYTTAGSRRWRTPASTPRRTAGRTPSSGLTGTTLYVAAVLRTLAVYRPQAVPRHGRRRHLGGPGVARRGRQQPGATRAG